MSILRLEAAAPVMAARATRAVVKNMVRNDVGLVCKDSG